MEKNEDTAGEQKETPETKQETPKENSNTGTEGQTTSTPLMDNAKEIADRQEKANSEHKTLLDRQEKMMAEQALGGRSVGGAVQAPVDPRSQNQKDIDYSNSIMNGEVTVEDVLMPGTNE